MNYYPFHLGDYAAHTGHLEPMEDLAYRRMLDAYYLREEPLPAAPADVARLVRMRSNVEDVEAVLREFFVLTDAGWTHARCEEEISRMQDRQTKARASAEASVNARKANAERRLNERSTNAERTLNERSTDVELPTPTPTPTPTPKKASPDGDGARKRASPPPAKPDDVEQQTWDDWLSLRTKKRASVSLTVVDEARAESVKAGLTLDRFLRIWCLRGSQGLQADWLKPAELQRFGRDAGVETFAQQAARERMEEIAPMVARQAPGRSAFDNAQRFMDGEIIDVTPPRQLSLAGGRNG